MARVVFSVMGAITFCYVAMVLLVLVLPAGHSSLHALPFTPAVIGRLLFFAVALSVLGLGLIGLRKWAALVFSLVALYGSFWAFTGAIHIVPWSWNGIELSWGLFLVSPSVFTVRYWRTLVWRAKRSEKDGNSSAD